MYYIFQAREHSNFDPTELLLLPILFFSFYRLYPQMLENEQYPVIMIVSKNIEIF